MAIKSLGKDKAPGPDGLTAEFFLATWNIIDKDFVAFLENLLFEGGDWARLNKAFIILIPKVEGAEDIAQFRPISLTSGALRVLSKTLALRLKPHMPSLVGDTQCAFLKGISTQYSFMAANELIHLCKRSDTDALLIKLDMTQAFDSIGWNFLLEILRKRGFSSLWVHWIKCLLCSGESAIMINGIPSKWFRHKKGLRQGDPLSPYLFLLVADIFSRMMRKVNSEGLISGIDSGGNKELTNLEFADDFIIFTRGIGEDLRNIKLLLRAFGFLSGLQVNLKKTMVIHILNDTTKAQRAANLLGCKAKNFPIKYLGLPLRNGRLTRDDWRKCWIADHSTGTWSAIWKGIYGAKQMFTMSLENKVGNGDNTLLWLDRWWLNHRLADLFPTLYHLSHHKLGSVSWSSLMGLGLGLVPGPSSMYISILMK
ncbi:hypothetical protein Cni_G25745 [Canna indica]|uniref:Reverse transcriptase domain-containing protein n=1 Tax=Canna indica TaxID=4628 RepID=A0AAQ3L0K7_9LILI|nr:hypothetical protein Cni_G25745 [Canna indica]